jgi:hypothetical protein
MESTIHECKGDYATAIARMEEGIKLGKDSGAGLKAELEESMKLRFLLLRYRLSAQDTLDHYRTSVDISSSTTTDGIVAGTEGAEQRNLIASLAAKESKVVAHLLERGPWRDAMQMPHHFVPQLTSRPWHSSAVGLDVSGTGSTSNTDASGDRSERRDGEGGSGGRGASYRYARQIKPLVKVLEAAAVGLREEYLRMKQVVPALMQQDQDCIQETLVSHNSSSGASRMEVGSDGAVVDGTGSTVGTAGTGRRGRYANPFLLPYPLTLRVRCALTCRHLHRCAR